MIFAERVATLKWLAKGIAKDLNSLTSGRRPLREQGFSLQGNVKTLEGTQSPDRDDQFNYLNEQVKTHQADNQPVVSVDTKKKELVGQYKNGGRDWRPKVSRCRSRATTFPVCWAR